MTIPRMIQGNSPIGSRYSQRWTTQVDGGLLYHAGELETNLKNKGTITRIAFDINGVEYIVTSGTELDVLDDINRYHKATGRIVLLLSQFKYRSLDGIIQTVLPIGLNETAILKVDFGPRDTSVAANQDPEIPTMSVKWWVSDHPVPTAPNGGRTFVPAMYELIPSPTAKGNFRWTFPNGSRGRYLQSLLFNESDVTINKVTVFRGNDKRREMTRADILAANERFGTLDNVPGYLFLDFTLFGFGRTHAIHTQELNLELEVSSAGAIRTTVIGFEVAN